MQDREEEDTKARSRNSKKEVEREKGILTASLSYKILSSELSDKKKTETILHL